MGTRRSDIASHAPGHQHVRVHPPSSEHQLAAGKGDRPGASWRTHQSRRRASAAEDCGYLQTAHAPHTHGQRCQHLSLRMASCPHHAILGEKKNNLRRWGMGVSHSTVAPEPRRPPGAHTRAKNHAAARLSSADRLVEHKGGLAARRRAAQNDADDRDGSMRQSAILPEGGTEELGCGKVPSSDDEIPPRAWQTQVAGQEFGWRVPPSGVQAGSERHQRSKSGACPETSKDAVKELRRFLRDSAVDPQWQDDKSCEDRCCARSPACLRDWASPRLDGQALCQQENGRPTSAPIAGGTGKTGNSLRMQLRREICASQARTRLHLDEQAEQQS